MRVTARQWLEDGTPDPDAPDAEREPERFTARGEGYRLQVHVPPIILDVDRLRRDSGSLWAELVVRTTLPGAQTFDGILSAGDVNLSSVRARQDRASYLSKRARVEDIDFAGLLEELALRVIAEERKGSPAVFLRDLPKPAPDEGLTIDGFPLLARHPVVVFGDGGAAKSLLALYLAGRLAQQGRRVGFFDWELAGEDHRVRLEALFGAAMPPVLYARCARPLVHEADRLARIVRDEGLDFAVFDSIAFACDGPPEAAEVAGRYFQSVRQLGDGLGSLHVAHVSKAEGADQKPFGSAFWHNGARATWFCRLADGLPGAVTIALYNRKSNLGPIRTAVGYEIAFSEGQTSFRPTSVADNADLAVGLTVRQRIAHALKGGARTVAELAADLEIKPDTVQKTVARAEGKVFTFLPGPDGTRRVGLLERQA